MELFVCLTLIIVPLTLSANVPIDPATIHAVFGPATANAPAAPGAPAQPIQKPNVTLTDPDYWDSADEYIPAPADYDKFDWTLTKRVAASSDDNFLLSPLGLKLALAILTEAATGQTQSELTSVLGLDTDRNAVRKKFVTILTSLKKKSPQYILNLGSRIYIDDSAEPRQRFAAIAEEFYDTELKTVNFRDPKDAAKEINLWISNITEGRLPKLVSEDDVVGNVVLVLNTLFFKGSWRHQFLPNDTSPALFYTSPKSQKKTLFMHAKNKFYYAESAKYDAKILRMPYLGNKYSMYIVVPNSLTGLPRVFGGLNDLRSEMNYLQEHIVEVTLPKFQFDYTSLLDAILKELGIRTAFEDVASLPGISRGQLLQQRLRISKVLQRSGIEVNELGSVAYSATEIALENKFGEDSNVNYEVVANKPFLFFIEDEATRQLLFTGRVSDPSLLDGALKLV